MIEAPAGKLSEWHSPRGGDAPDGGPPRGSTIRGYGSASSTRVSPRWETCEMTGRPITRGPVAQRPRCYGRSEGPGGVMWVVKGKARARTEPSVQGQGGSFEGQDGTEKHGLRDNVPPNPVMVRRQTRERLGGACGRDGGRGRAPSSLVTTPCRLVTRLTQLGGGVAPPRRPSRPLAPFSTWWFLAERGQTGGCAERARGGKVSCVCEANGYEARAEHEDGSIGWKCKMGQRRTNGTRREGGATVVGLTFLSRICRQRRADVRRARTRTRRGRGLEAGTMEDRGDERIRTAREDAVRE